MKSRLNLVAYVLLMVALVAAAGCKKKQPAPNVPTAPPVAAAPAPTAQLSATPTVITAGDQVQLSWRTTDAATVSIDGIGDVPTAGVKSVSPAESTTYHLIARGPGGVAESSVRVTVNAPPAVQVQSNTMSEEEEFKANVQDIFFDYDSYDVRDDAHSVVARDAAYLSSHPNAKIVIGGYCDDRGSNEYNLALGQNRAESARKALQAAGVDASRMRVVSYGKEKPFCSEETEECWQQNRRAGFALDR